MDSMRCFFPSRLSI